MKLKKYFSVAALALSMATSSAFAHHHDLGTVAALYETSQELSQAVAYSTLSYTVKNTVYRFVNDVGQLYSCAPSQSPVGINHHHDLPAQCLYIQQQVSSDFNRVGYYLSDAYDYPQVFQAYHETGAALNALED